MRTGSRFAATSSTGCWYGRWRPFPQQRRGNQRDGEANREGLDKRHRCVEERIVVLLLELPQLLNLGLDGRGTGAGSPELLDQMGAVLVHEVVHEVEVENLPRHDITNARDQGNR